MNHVLAIRENMSNSSQFINGIGSWTQGMKSVYNLIL